MEIWRTIPLPEIEGLYEVSNLGNIRRAPYPIKTHKFTNKRRVYVSLSSPTIRKEKQSRGKTGNMRNLFVHRLVALAFCKPRSGCDQVNHKNGDSMDNRAENLEWVTGPENIKHAMDNGLYKAPPNKKIDTKEAVRLHKAGMDAVAIGRKLGVSQTAVLACIGRYVHGISYKIGAKERKRLREKSSHG